MFNCCMVSHTHAVSTAYKISDPKVFSTRETIWKACLWHWRVVASVVCEGKSLGILLLS